MTTIPPERVKELIEWAEKTLELHRLRCDLAATWGVNDTVAEADLLAILDEHAALKAENEGLAANRIWLLDQWNESMTKQEKNTYLAVEAMQERNKLKVRAEKAEAELERQAPLIDAVMGVSFADIKAGVELHTIGICRPILRAALALKMEKK